MAEKDQWAQGFGVAGVLFGIIGCVTGVISLWISYENRQDASEQVSISIFPDRRVSQTEVSINLDQSKATPPILVTNGHAVRQVWRVIVANTSTSAITLTSIRNGQAYRPIEPMFDAISTIVMRFEDVPTIPITIEPSKVIAFSLITDTPQTDHTPFVAVVTSRKRVFKGFLLPPS